MEVYGFDGELVELTIVFDDAGGDYEPRLPRLHGAAAVRRLGRC